MSNVVNLESNNEIVDQASEWVSKLDRGLSEKEIIQFERWISKGYRQREILFEMISLWDGMNDLSRLASLFPHQNKKTFHSYSLKYAGFAASVIFFFVIGIFYFSGNVRFSSSSVFISLFGDNQESHHVYETQVGEYSRVVLSDGSKMTLNTNSLVNVKYYNNSRAFYLSRGEVHIDVAHDNNRPLSVITRSKIVQAVGTAFNVRVLDDMDVELIVTNGVVRVADLGVSSGIAGSMPKVLSENFMEFIEGEKVVISSDGTQVNKISQIQIQDSLSWQEGNLVFRGETLQSVLQEVGRYTDVVFDIRDEDVKNLRIAGMYRAGDVNELLLAMKQNFNIKYKRVEGNTILLKK